MEEMQYILLAFMEEQCRLKNVIFGFENFNSEIFTDLMTKFKMCFSFNIGTRC